MADKKLGKGSQEVQVVVEDTRAALEAARSAVTGYKEGRKRRVTRVSPEGRK